MSQDGRIVPAFQPRRADTRFGDDDSQPILGELMDVLKAHPRGLRRWSVMRAMREIRRRQARDIPQKFEDNVEWVFRRFCAGEPEAGVSAANAPFYRPRETAGEVWALAPERADIPADVEAAIFPPQ